MYNSQRKKVKWPNSTSKTVHIQVNKDVDKVIDVTLAGSIQIIIIKDQANREKEGNSQKQQASVSEDFRFRRGKEEKIQKRKNQGWLK